MGPRQIGKSTVVKQVLKDIDAPYLFFSADDVPASGQSWLADCWSSARALRKAKGYLSLILVIDEIQKIPNWSETVKKEWDTDTFGDCDIKVLLLGSSRVLLEKGLSESLAGRFEEIRMTHWSFPEMRDAFDLTLENYLFFGGYPGKPALLRQTFELGAAYSGQLLSLNKMLASLQDAGNTSTLAAYINLLNDSGLLCGLQKYSVDMARRKASIPKFQVYNNALKIVLSQTSFEHALIDRSLWGRIFESGIGAHIVNQAFKHRFETYYWRERNYEMDFVMRKGDKIIAVEVKSNACKATEGLDKFRSMFNPSASFIVGDGGITAEEFLGLDMRNLF